MVGLAAVRMLVGPEPERLHGRHAELAGAAHVLVEAVADEQRAAGSTPSASSARSKISGCGLRLPTSDEKTAKSSRSAIPIRSRSRWSSQPGSNAFETSPSLSPLVPERVEQRVRVPGEPAGRLPCGVLGLEEAPELVLVHGASKSPSSRSTSPGYSISSIVPGAQKSGW